jgi:hypothetical protein
VQVDRRAVVTGQSAVVVQSLGGGRQSLQNKLEAAGPVRLDYPPHCSPQLGVRCLGRGELLSELDRHFLSAAADERAHLTSADQHVQVPHQVDRVLGLKGIVQRNLRWVESRLKKSALLSHYTTNSSFFKLKGHHCEKCIKPISAS